MRVKRDENTRLVIGYHLRGLRKKKYGTATRCAADMDVNLSQWSTWESAVRTPTDDRLASIAKKLGCTTEELLTEPEDWGKKKVAYLADIRKRSDPIESDPVPDSGGAQPRAERDGALADYMDIVSALAQAQSMYDKGGINQADFLRKLQSIKEFVHFEYRGILPNG